LFLNKAADLFKYQALAQQLLMIRQGNNDF